MDRWRHGATGAIIEAVQLTEDNVEEVARWAVSADIVEEIDPFTKEKSRALNVKVPTGVERLSQGQYLIKYRGTFIVQRPSRFMATYSKMSQKPGFAGPDAVRDSHRMKRPADYERD